VALSGNKLNPNGCAEVKIFGFYLDKTKMADAAAADPTAAKALAVNYYSAIQKVIAYGRDQARPLMLQYVDSVDDEAKGARLLKTAKELAAKLGEVDILIKQISAFR
jgi:hypothetical protein